VLTTMSAATTGVLPATPSSADAIKTILFMW